MSKSKKDILGEKVSNAPTAPGCYLMKGARGKVIYVGRAVSLRNRVRNYFTRSGDNRFLVEFIRKSVRDIEFIVTDSLREAIILENTLIKKHQPKYNIRLKDDKTFLSIRLKPKEEWPRLQVVRIRKTPPRDGAKYFGPYTSAQACRETIRLMNKLFPLRKCSDSNFRNRVRPCLYYEIRQCLGPCCGLADHAAYRAVLDSATKMLSGRSDEVLEEMKAGMKQFSDEERFEEAAALRDKIRAIEHVREKQKVVEHIRVDRDVFAYCSEAGEYEFQHLAVRRGVLSGSGNFSIREQRFPSREVLASFLMQFYSREDAFLPAEIYVPEDFDERAALEEVLSERRGKKVSIIAPLKGDRLKLVEMARKNAEVVFREKHSEQERLKNILRSIQGKLKLTNFPRRIECYDISNIGGTDAVGSMVVFEDGWSAKSQYKRYRIRTVSGSDDYAMMREVLSRRLKHLPSEQRRREGAESEKVKWAAPDLILVDGGKGQLNIAARALEDLGVSGIDLASIAKVRDTETGRKSKEMDIFYVPGRSNPVVFRREAAELFLLQRIRDEAHRFAIAYHKKVRRRKGLSTVLDAIPGIGPARRIALLKHFGSVERISQAGVEDLQQVPGLTESLAGAVMKALSEKRQRRD